MVLVNEGDHRDDGERRDYSTFEVRLRIKSLPRNVCVGYRLRWTRSNTEGTKPSIVKYSGKSLTRFEERCRSNLPQILSCFTEKTGWLYSQHNNVYMVQVLSVRFWKYRPQDYSMLGPTRKTFSSWTPKCHKCSPCDTLTSVCIHGVEMYFTCLEVK